MKWISAYDSMNAAMNKTLIDSETMKIVKYFIASNTAAKEFDSAFFRDLFSDFKIKIPCSTTFSEVILKSVFDKLNACNNIKLEEAESICLISDIWTNKQMKDFMGLAANIISLNFVKEAIFIGMTMSHS